MSKLRVTSLSTLDDSVTVNVEDLATKSTVVDSSKVNEQSSLSNSVVRTQHEKNSDFISLSDFGVVGDGISDDTLAFQNALNAIAIMSKSNSYGGSIHIPYNFRVFISSNITIPAGVSIYGFSATGVPGQTGYTGRIAARGSSILLSSSATITLSGGNKLSSLLFVRSTMTGTENNAASYAGTALTCGGEDVVLEDVTIIGFAQAFTSTSYGRQTFVRCRIDCIAGIYISGSYDVARIVDCHIYPFGTVAAGTSAITTADNNHYLYRDGTAIKISSASWPKIEGTFIYGYAYGIWFNSVTNGTIINSGTECVRVGSVMLGTAGLFIDGDTSDTMISASQFAHHNHCVYLNASSGTHQILDHIYTRDGDLTGIAIAAGEATLNGCSTVGYSATASIGVKVITTEKVRIVAHHTRNENIGIRVDTNKCSILGVTATGTTTVVSNVVQNWTLASASTLPITSDNNHYYITGSTTASMMAPTYSGHEVTLTFESAITLTSASSGDGQLRVSGGSLSVAAGQSVRFVLNGVTGARTWRQISSPVTY